MYTSRNTAAYAVVLVAGVLILAPFAGILAKAPPATQPNSDAAVHEPKDTNPQSPGSRAEPPRPVLTGEVAEKVAELEKQIDELHEQDKYAEAIPLAEEALAIRREHQAGWTNAHGDPAEWYEIEDARRTVEDLRQRVSLSPEERAELVEARETDSKSLGLYAQGRYAEVLELTQKTLEIRRRTLRDDHPDTLIPIYNMGTLLQAQGKLAEAEIYHREALEGLRRVLGDDHPVTLGSINNMGALLESQGKLAEAETYHREALEGKRRVLGNNHPDTLGSIGNMGHLLQSQGRLAEAETYHREALEGKRRVLSDDHPSALISINNMGALLESQGKLAEAEAYYRDALEGLRRVLGDEHPDTLASISNMGGLLLAQGKLAEAEGYFREALEGRRRVLGDDHPVTLGSINNMGALLESQGKLAEAETYHREALEGKRRVLGDDHPDTLSSIAAMGNLLYSQGNLAEAEGYYREALEGQRRMLGDDHPDLLRSLNNLGSLLQHRGRLAEAEPYLREALEGHCSVLGIDDRSTLFVIMNMGHLLNAQGKPAEAEPYCREALDVAERLRTRIIGAERGRAVYAEQLRLSVIAARLAALLIQTSQPAEAWSASERGRGRALLDLLDRSDLDLLAAARVRAAGDPAAVAALDNALKREQQAQVDLTTAEALLVGTQKQRQHTEGRDDLADKEKAQRLAALDEQIVEQHATVKSKRRALGEATANVFVNMRGLFPDAKPMSIEKIRAGLEPGELVLGCTWTGEFVLLLVTQGAAAGEDATSEGEGVAGFTLVKGTEEVEELTKLAQEVREALASRPAGSANTVDRDRCAVALSDKLIPESVRAQVATADPPDRPS